MQITIFSNNSKKHFPAFSCHKLKAQKNQDRTYNIENKFNFNLKKTTYKKHIILTVPEMFFLGSFVSKYTIFSHISIIMPLADSIFIFDYSL